MKICSRCHTKQPLTNFNKKTGKKVHSACKQCWKTIRRTHYLSNSNKIIKAVKVRKQQKQSTGHPSWVLKNLRLMQKNHKKRNLPTITLVQLQKLARTLAKRLSKQLHCPFTGVKLIPGKNLSLDHKKPISRYPELAFTPSNLQWVCRAYNMAKHNLTGSEFRKLCKQILQNR